jgi:hypothetical protein
MQLQPVIPPVPLPPSPLPQVQRLAMVTLLAVFKDILPGYRIRPPTEKELQVKVGPGGVRGGGWVQESGAAASWRLGAGVAGWSTTVWRCTLLSNLPLL